jgi:short-chain fatty acids transporter
MMKRVVSLFTRLCEAYLPDAFVFSLLLTLFVFILGLILTPHSPITLIEFWGKDFWALNAFAMQMVFILISGHMLATSPMVKMGLKKITSLVHSETKAIIVLSLFSTVACFINWGFGLIVSGILAVELGRKLRKVNFGLFVATAYAGFLVWHGGLSGSIPLKIAGKDEILNRVYPGLSIPLSETLFSSWNLVIVISLLLLMPVLALVMRTDEKVEVISSEIPAEEIFEAKNFREKVENFSGLNWLFFFFCLIVFFSGLKQGDSLDINKINWIFLFLAILLHQTPRKFLMALHESFGFASGIAIQFPFYAGIMGLMQYSGLADLISEIFVGFSTASTLPLWTFLSGGIVNFFIPSGGGQWVVQGPIMLKAAKELGSDPAKVSMALAWGDAWTNLVQPFWALPILALAKLRLKDIMGYCLIFTLFSGVLISFLFLWL